MEEQQLQGTIFMSMGVQLLLLPTLKELDTFIVLQVEVHIVLLILRLIDKEKGYSQIQQSLKQLPSLRNHQHQQLFINQLVNTRFHGQLRQALEAQVCLLPNTKLKSDNQMVISQLILNVQALILH